MNTTFRPSEQQDALVRVNRRATFWRGFGSTVRDIWAYRELLTNLTHKELKVKYKDSALGFVWALARPLFLLAVYSIVFGTFLRAGIPYFSFYLFAGLVAWDLFGTTVGGCTGSIVGNPGLIKKVYFPREILPLSVVGSSTFNFGLQLIVLVGALLLFQYDWMGPNVALFPLAFVALVMFMTAMGLFFAVVNVYFRDMEHLQEVLLLFWFWMTPIVYSVNDALPTLNRYELFGVKVGTIWMLNPMTNIVMGFQRVFYKHVSVTAPDGKSFQILYADGYAPYVWRLLYVVVLSAVLIWLGQRVFAKAQGNFAQEF